MNQLGKYLVHACFSLELSAPFSWSLVFRKSSFSKTLPTWVVKPRASAAIPVVTGAATELPTTGVVASPHAGASTCCPSALKSKHYSCEDQEAGAETESLLQKLNRVHLDAVSEPYAHR